MRLRHLATAVTALSLPTLVLLAPPASAHGSPGASYVVASGLNNPRHLSFSPNGDLYIAESGTGGTGPCIAGGEGEACFGLTGSVTRVSHGTQRRVLKGLPSVAGEGGASAAGPGRASRSTTPSTTPSPSASAPLRQRDHSCRPRHGPWAPCRWAEPGALDVHPRRPARAMSRGRTRTVVSLTRTPSASRHTGVASLWPTQAPTRSTTCTPAVGSTPWQCSRTPWWRLLVAA